MTQPSLRQGALLLLVGGLVMPNGSLGQDRPATASAPVAAAAPDRSEPAPAEIADMPVVEKLNAQVPPDLEFTNQDGRKVRLGDYFDGKRPVILNLNYYRCPMLCGLVLNGMTTAAKELDWTIGDQFRVVTVSFDPLETPDLASLKRQNYLTEYGRPPAANGWDFLTGKSKPIKALLDATGYPVRWDDPQKQWVHPACLVLLTPDGHISRYLYGVYFEPKTLRLSLVEASQGKIGTTVDHILLYCFHYDPAGGRYAVAAMNVMRAGGLIALLVVGGFVGLLWRRERHGRAPAAGHVEGPAEAKQSE